MLRYFKRVPNFRDKRNPNRSVREALISQFLKKDTFSIEMDPCMQFPSSKGLEKTLTFKISLKRIVTFSSEYLKRLFSFLQKGSGYHLDLFVVAVTVLICSFFGLPWFVASTVVSITHVTSLRQESECTAPGERPKFIGVR